MSKPISNRLKALDVFRGLTIAFMIIVNTPGSWSHVFPPLLHAQWHGWTPTDLVFPFFLFIVGVSMSLSMRKRNEITSIFRKIAIRTVTIFLIGVFLNWFPFYDTSFSELRYFGVLQRIALAYCIGAILCYKSTDKSLLPLTLLVQFIYIVLLEVGGTGDIFSLETNAVRRLDLALFGEQHLYKGFGIAFDPEGLLSTLGSVGNVMIGYFTGRKLFEISGIREKAIFISVYGFLFLMVGLMLDYFGTPINKPLWTPSYAFFSSGMAAVILAVLIYVIDGLKFERLNFGPLVFGVNALAAYVLSILLSSIFDLIPVGDNSLHGYLYEVVFQPVGDRLGSALYAVSFMLLIWVMALFLYTRRIFIKL